MPEVCYNQNSVCLARSARVKTLLRGSPVMKGLLKNALCALLAASMMLALPASAFADEDIVTATADASLAYGEAPEMTIFDPDELKGMVEGLIEEFSANNVRPGRISFAYTYLATGETWYYNPDMWSYSASMYKVPLMMILAEKEAAGELTQDSDIKGITLAKAENSILVYSNNDYAHLMLNYLGTDQQARELYKQYAPSLPADYYHSDFVDYSFFTVRFMNEVMSTLYNSQERFPHIIDCLKQAQPEEYFHLNLDPSIQIAQKYGSYNEYNSTSGIIYTPNPIILTVMMERVERSDRVIGQAAKLFVDYTYTLDAKLEGYLAEKDAAAKQAAEESELARQAEEERLAQQQAEEEAARLAQAELARADEAWRQQEAAELAAKAARLTRLKNAALIAAGACAVAVIIIAAMRAKKRRREKERAAKGRGGYSPRH